jgi:Fur family iron response transcriptional regulator
MTQRPAHKERPDNNSSGPGGAACNLEISRNLPSAQEARTQAMLARAGLRPTRQRVALGGLLFDGEPRHVTADELFRDAAGAGFPLSLATAYNTLNQFAEAGLVRRIAVNGERTFFDTDVGDHHHFHVEAESRIVDVPTGSIEFGRIPLPPDGYEITAIDVVIRLKLIATSKQSTEPVSCVVDTAWNAHPDARAIERGGGTKSVLAAGAVTNCGGRRATGHCSGI